ncbi:MAG: hypothetical protein AAB036_05375 [Elusimicrobiota bacterium]
MPPSDSFRFPARFFSWPELAAGSQRLEELAVIQNAVFGERRTLFSCDSYSVYYTHTQANRLLPFYQSDAEFLDLHLSSFQRRINRGVEGEIVEPVSPGDVVLYRKNIILGNFTAASADMFWETLQVQAPGSPQKPVPFEEGMSVRRGLRSTAGLFSQLSLKPASKPIPSLLARTLQASALGDGHGPVNLKSVSGDQILIVFSGTARISQSKRKSSLIRKGHIIRIPSACREKITITPEGKDGYSGLHVVIAR